MPVRSPDDVYQLLTQHLSASEGVKQCLDRWLFVGASLRQRWGPTLSEEEVDEGLDELEAVFEEYEEALLRAAADMVCKLADRVSDRSAGPTPP